jgi:radical SAM protein with 4Fe4S-binding SPASM domain
VSIDGATPGTYASIRVRGKLERVVRNVELLVETRARLQSSTPHLHLVVVIMKRNLDELPDLVRMARRLSFEEVFVQHLCHDFGEESLPAEYRPMREYVERETLLSEDAGRVEAVFATARQAAEDAGLVLRLPRIRPKEHAPGTPGRERCDWPWKGAYVSYQGLAMPCCMISTPDRMNFGNIAERGVAATWHGADYQRFRDRLGSDDAPDICKSCSVYRGTF